MASFRIALLAAVIAGLSWFQFVNLASARELSRGAADLFDPRPGRDILFIGNSRMFFNDLPSMVRAVADSAGAPVKYRVRMHALPGRTFVDHARSKTVRALLEQRWDRVILQANSSANLEADSRVWFDRYGRQLVGQANAAGSPASLVVNWTYSDEAFRDRPGWTRGLAYELIQADHRALAAATGAELINVGTAFKLAEAAEPAIPLIPDGNHPSPPGSYVYALMVYHHLTGADVRAVRHVPDGVSEAEALALRNVVADYVGSAIRG